MIHFQIGNEVRVVGVPADEWCGASGVIVKTVERVSDDHAAGFVQEGAVQFAGARRWFSATHLVRAVPDKAVRFFRTGRSHSSAHPSRFAGARDHPARCGRFDYGPPVARSKAGRRENRTAAARICVARILDAIDRAALWPHGDPRKSLGLRFRSGH